MCANILPHKVELFRRHIVTDPFCPNCGTAPETLAHVLMECRGVYGVWSRPPFNVQPVTSCESMRSIFSKLNNSLSYDLFLVALVLCWKIWDMRNKQLYGEKAFLKDFWLAKFPASLHKPASSPQDHWIPPPSCTVKINVDFGLPKGMNYHYVGGVLGMNLVNVSGGLGKN